MHLIAFKGLPGTGKSTLARALARELRWPLIDKDDIKDMLDGHTPEAGGLAYDALFNLVRRQALLGLDVICDSPLTFERSYTRLREIAGETGAKLFIVESTCSDEQAWLERIEARKMLSLQPITRPTGKSFRATASGLQQHLPIPSTIPISLWIQLNRYQNC